MESIKNKQKHKAKILLTSSSLLLLNMNQLGCSGLKSNNQKVIEQISRENKIATASINQPHNTSTNEKDQYKRDTNEYESRCELIMLDLIKIANNIYTSSPASGLAKYKLRSLSLMNDLIIIENTLNEIVAMCDILTNEQNKELRNIKTEIKALHPPFYSLINLFKQINELLNSSRVSKTARNNKKSIKTEINKLKQLIQSIVIKTTKLRNHIIDNRINLRQNIQYTDL